MALPLAILGILGAGIGLASTIPPVSRVMVREFNKLLSNEWIDPLQSIVAFRRNVITKETLIERMKGFGFSEDEVEKLLKVTEFIPAPDDVIRFGVREAFRDDIAAKYGYDEENPAEVGEARDFTLSHLKAVGMSPETFKLFWRAHWDLPSPSQVFEMVQRLHPDQLPFKKKTIEGLGLTEEMVSTTKDEVRDLLKIADIPVYWRNRFMPLMFTPITRVDVRRFEDLGLFTKEDLVFRYREIGYSPEDAETLATFTMVLNRKDEFKAALKSGAMTVKQLEKELRKLGVPESGIERWKTVLIPPAKAERLSKERDLTKSEIIKGLKKGIISVEQAADMLQGLGYDKDEAEYIMAINLVEAKGDPETPLEMRRVVELQKKAIGLPHVEITDEMIQLEKEIKELKEKSENLKKMGKLDEVGLIEGQIGDKEYRLRQLMISKGLI